ncbi:MAG: hypothetical protein IT379_12515 [Deltaproteobacteria bacterium]|nr:hypothetical protein [Deltaproteobacteria bacterium]
MPRPDSSPIRTSPRTWHIVLLVACVVVSSLASLPPTWGEEIPIPDSGTDTGLLVTITASHEPTVSGVWRGDQTTFVREDAGTEWTGSGVFYVPPDTHDIIASIGGSCGGCCGACPEVEPSIVLDATEEVGAWELETESGEGRSSIDPQDGATQAGVIESSRPPMLELVVGSVSSRAGGYVTTPIRRPGTTTWDFDVRWFPAPAGEVAIDPAEATWTVHARALGYCPSPEGDCLPGPDDFVGPITF